MNEADEPALRAWLSGHADALDGALGRRCGSADAKSVESMIAYANLPIDGFAAGAARAGSRCAMGSFFGQPTTNPSAEEPTWSGTL